MPGRPRRRLRQNLRLGVRLARPGMLRAGPTRVRHGNRRRLQVPRQVPFHVRSDGRAAARRPVARRPAAAAARRRRALGRRRDRRLPAPRRVRRGDRALLGTGPGRAGQAAEQGFRPALRAGAARGQRARVLRQFGAAGRGAGRHAMGLQAAARAAGAAAGPLRARRPSSRDRCRAGSSARSRSRCRPRGRSPAPCRSPGTRPPRACPWC